MTLKSARLSRTYLDSFRNLERCSKTGGVIARLGKVSPTLSFNIESSAKAWCRKTNLEAFQWHKCGIPSPQRTLDNGLYADQMLATTPQEGGQQALKRLFSVPAERNYSQSLKNMRKDVNGKSLSSNRRRSQVQTVLLTNFSPAIFLHTLGMRTDPSVQLKEPGSVTSFQAPNRKTPLPFRTFDTPSVPTQCRCGTIRNWICHRRTQKT